MSWTTPANVAAIWPRKAAMPVTDEKVQSYIDNVERQIKRYYPKISDRITSNEIAVEDIADAVSRILVEYIATEGTAYVQESQSYGNTVAASYTLGADARKTLLLTEADLAQFAPVNSNSNFSLDTAPNGRVRYCDDSGVFSQVENPDGSSYWTAGY